MAVKEALGLLLRIASLEYVENTTRIIFYTYTAVGEGHHLFVTACDYRNEPICPRECNVVIHDPSQSYSNEFMHELKRSGFVPELKRHSQAADDWRHGYCSLHKVSRERNGMKWDGDGMQWNGMATWDRDEMDVQVWK